MNETYKNLAKLLYTKNQIRTAIESAGIEVGDRDCFLSYADKILSITSDEREKLLLLAGENIDFSVDDDSLKINALNAPEEIHVSTDGSLVLQPGKVFVIDEAVDSLSLSFDTNVDGRANFYAVEFSTNENATVSIPDSVKNAEDIEFLPGKHYSVSVYNNYLLKGEFDA